MKQIDLSFKTQAGSIVYQIDTEGKTYSVSQFDSDGKQAGEPEVKEIADPKLLAKRLYLIIQAGLAESKT